MKCLFDSLTDSLTIFLKMKRAYKHFMTRSLSCILMALFVVFCTTLPLTVKADEGFLLDDFLGWFGNVTEDIQNGLTDIVAQTGLDDAADAAITAIEDLTEGKVPVISNLEDPFNGNVEDAIDTALEGTEIAVEIMNKLAGGSVMKAVVKSIQDSEIIKDGDYGITLLSGRLRLIKDGDTISLYRIIVGPAGSRIITGVSNAEQLGGSVDPYLANPDKHLIGFTYIAVGYTHISSRIVLEENDGPAYSPQPPLLVAETFVKINGQWVQIKLDGPDLESLELGASFTIGVKAGVNAELMAKLGAAIIVDVNVKAAYADEIVEGTIQAMSDVSLSKDIDVLKNAAKVIQAGFQYLNAQDSEKLGKASLSVGASGKVGIGAWDTGVSAVSAGGGVTITVPLTALVQLSEDVLQSLLDYGIQLGSATQELSSRLLEEDKDALDAARNTMKENSTNLVNEILSGFGELITSDFEMEVNYEVAGAGEINPGSGNTEQNISFLEYSVNIPVGDLYQTLKDDPDAVGHAIDAASKLMMVGYGSDEEFDWDSYTNIAEGIEFSFLVITPLRVQIGISEVSLSTILEMIVEEIEYITPILTGVKKTAVEGKIDLLRGAVESAINGYGDHAEESFSKLLNSINLIFATGIGANAELGAEGVLSLGLGAKLEGRVKGSLLLLLLGSSAYHEENNTEIAEVSFPVSFAAGAGASIGEGVELEAAGEVITNANLFDLTFIHWDNPLPPPSGMTVAGFEVLEFDGVVNADESFEGTGFLMLPMGGIVEANFAADAGGFGSSGKWWGGIDLGDLGTTLGKITLGNGTLSDQGISGNASLNLLGSSYEVSYTLSSTGMVYGFIDFNVTILEQEVAFNFKLQENGTVAGRGTIQLAGLSTVMDLQVTGEGFTGSGTMDVLGSTLKATDLIISSEGEISGTFTGDLTVAGQTLSGISLQFVDGELKGTAKMDLFGISGAELNITIVDGAVTATYLGTFDLFGTSISRLDLTITQDKITYTAFVASDQLDELSEIITGFISETAKDARGQLAEAQVKLKGYQDDVDGLTQDIKDRIDTVIAERKELAENAKIAFNAAAAALTGIIDQIDKLNNRLVNDIKTASAALNQAKSNLLVAKKSLTNTDKAIKRHKAWYDNLSALKKVANAAFYSAKLGTLEGYKLTAEAALTVAQSAVTLAQSALDEIIDPLLTAIKESEVAKKTQEAIRDAKEELYNAAK
ncbi:MAG: hypothetical protein D3924_05895 [Candidatus Electrothrix sp. AR4]|nr:hypothetical protein [Candidatus Electrothrix sp. AR4]